MRVAKVVAIVWAIGAVVHLTGLVLFLFGKRIYGPDYPWWRHAAMSTIDMAIALVALRRPTWLVAALSLLLIEQVVVNGFEWMAAGVAIAIAACLAAIRIPVVARHDESRPG